jgi:hypothetical protein
VFLITPAETESSPKLRSWPGEVADFPSSPESRREKKALCANGSGGELELRLPKKVNRQAATDADKDVGVYTADAVKKSAHITVYSTEEAGKSIAHVFSHL